MVVEAFNGLLTVRSPVFANYLPEYKVMHSFVLKISAGIRDRVEITQF
jgi:hypothetical protein